MPANEPVLVPGLAGVPAAESAISLVDGQAGLLTYRGIPIAELAEHGNFEEVAWLLLYGELPTAKELESFRAALREHRTLPEGLVDVIRALPRDGHPMDALQACTAALGMYAGSGDPVVCILAAMPVLVATFDRLRRGEEPVLSDPALDTAANFLWMVTGEKPDALASHVLDVALILHADHTMNASTFTARVVASTEADPYSVCAAAVGSLSGPLHGGANERVLAMLDEIDGPDAVADWLDDKLAARSKITGLGHRVYKVKDPRAVILQGLARQLFDELGRTPEYDIAVRLEEVAAERLGAKGIYPNVDFYSGFVYAKLGIPTDLFTPVFAIARTAGWLAHWREQMSNNRIFRPKQVYVGRTGAAYVPLAERG